MAVVNNDLCGILCMYKPKGFTSFDVIAKLRGILKMKRLGHAGTLDPMAVGVLPVFVGTATKACDMLTNHDKSYRAGFKLGVSTDTQDITGRVISESSAAVSLNMLKEAAAGFSGEIFQLPPMYSAVSVNGKRLYELAREGKTVERTPRRITVYSLSVCEYDEASRCGIMEIACSKGTYIRTIISDIGDALGCGGVMTSLLRTSACGFGLSDCVTFEQLEEAAALGESIGKWLLPTESVFCELPKITLSPAQERMYRNGVRLDAARVRTDRRDSLRYAVFAADGKFLGTAALDKKDGLIRVEKNFF